MLVQVSRAHRAERLCNLSSSSQFRLSSCTVSLCGERDSTCSSIFNWFVNMKVRDRTFQYVVKWNFFTTLNLLLLQSRPRVMHMLCEESTSAPFPDSEIFEAPHYLVQTRSVVSCSNEDSESETDPELFQFLNTIAQERKQTRAHSLSSEDCRESYELDLDGHDLLESPAEDTVRGLFHSPGSPICRSPLPVDKITKGFKVHSSQAQPRQKPSKSRHTNLENPATSSNVPTACWVGKHSTASLIQAGDLQRPADGIIKVVSRTNGRGAALGALAQVLAVWLLLLLAQYHVLESQRASR